MNLHAADFVRGAPVAAFARTRGLGGCPAFWRTRLRGIAFAARRRILLQSHCPYDFSHDYKRQEHHDFLGGTAQALKDEGLQAALIRLTSTLMAGNRRGYAALADSDRLRDHAKRIKEHTLAHLDKYLEQLEASVQKLGGHVHWASTAADAREIVLGIARPANCKHAVKSKSMTSEEIHLNPALEAAGLEVTETDYGEFIIQIAKERPSHLVAPEAAAFHELRLRRHPEDYSPRIRSLLEEGVACPAPEYARCKEHQAQLKQQMAFEGEDTLLTPATTGPAPAADTTGDPAFNSPWSYTGLPTVSLPTGHFVDGLPLAIQLVGRPNDERRLLAVAAWCERALEVKPLQPA